MASAKMKDTTEHQLPDVEKNFDDIKLYNDKEHPDSERANPTTVRKTSGKKLRAVSHALIALTTSL